MRRSLHIINGLSVMVLSAIGIVLITTNHFVNAQSAAKQPVQPKIATIKSLHKMTQGQTTKAFAWPAQAGKIISLEKNTTHIQITPAVQRGVTQRTYWAFRYVWSDEQPNTNNIMSDAKNIAVTYFKPANFIASANSPLIAINAATNRGRYLTVYSFATNKDRVVGAPNFPLGIDYAAAITYRVASETDSIPTEEQKINVVPAPEPTNDDWSQMETTLPGYKQ